ncbi:D-alanyl-alanine synthetase [Myxosarcina sp. GI1]|uniref:D-alanine--D-alanine ligase family protein n=1 Tax=Myxosarcina sp. GI1 TaxID=1541065 RepID=UPI00056B9989|nr:D-alanyl-alanine synthetase [Myxosarcina sp. GI1]
MKFNYSFNSFSQYLNELTKKLRLAVIYGGDKQRAGAVIYKTHNPRSTKTYEAVAKNIAQAFKNLGFQNVWLLPDDMSLAAQLKAKQIHLAWLNTGGVQGYDPVCHTPALLEMLGVPYIGHSPINSSILDNKHLLKRELKGLGFPTSPFMVWHPHQETFQPNNLYFQHLFGNYTGAFLVKPVSGRASLNIHFVDKPDALAAAIADVQRVTHNSALIEAYLPGREFCIAVGGYVTYINLQLQKRQSPFAFSAIERILEPDEKIFTSMDKKAITSDRLRLLSDREPIKQQLEQIAKDVYRSFNLTALIRLDLRTDRSGKLYILEANPKPDLKRPTANATSLVAQGLTEYGMSYEDLILSLFCDRLDYLLSNYPHLIAHIVELLD